MNLTSKAALQIQKPIKEVFEGIVNPEKMTNYFISESTGRLETGKDVVWKFPEFEDRFQITQVVVENNQSISFVWDPDTVVNITLESLPDQSTKITATESGKSMSDDNLNWLINNTAGWSNFLCCMKAFLEHEIRLREGAYDFMRKK